VALAASPNLAPVLADRPSVSAGTLRHSPEWSREGLGSRLLGQTLRVLALPTCSPASMDAVLRVVESVLSLDGPQGAAPQISTGDVNPAEGQPGRDLEDLPDLGENPTETLSETIFGPHKSALLGLLRDLATGRHGVAPTGNPRGQGPKKRGSVCSPAASPHFCPSLISSHKLNNLKMYESRSTNLGGLRHPPVVPPA
jgi:hypothetical protein